MKDIFYNQAIELGTLIEYTETSETYLINNAKATFYFDQPEHLTIFRIVII